MRRIVITLTLVAAAIVGLPAAGRQAGFLPIDEIRPGMVGTGRTVFEGDRLDEFTVRIVGVLRNVMGPQRDLILARLEGGPLANTGVIAGMSGSPVYVDGRLIGAVSYSLGSFPKEPLAGVTPIAEMTAEVNGAVPRVARTNLQLPVTESGVLAALGDVMRRATAPLSPASGFSVLGPDSLASLAPTLRPIGAAMVLGGFDPSIDAPLRQALSVESAARQTPRPAMTSPGGALRPGDPVGMSLVRGDMEMGATGTVTHVDGTRVYAFGHPFLSLGPATLAMTEAHVFTVLPSLDSSMKIASLGSVIGTITQDRSTAVGGTLGAGPSELEVRLTLTSARAPSRRFTFFVAHDPALTPLFTYVSVLNALTSYGRQTGAASIATSGTLSFGADGRVTFDDVFAGDTAVTTAASSLMTPLAAIVANEFKATMPDHLDLDVHMKEVQEAATIERVWLDTTKPKLGGTYAVQIQLRDFRGASRTVSMPITVPTQVDGPLTLLVSDGPTLTAVEQRDLKPGRATSLADLVTQANDIRRNNRLYVRLISSAPGTVVSGDPLPSLPASVQSVLRTDASVSRTPVSRSVVGAWDQRFDVAIRGSRELTFTPRAAD